MEVQLEMDLSTDERPFSEPRSVHSLTADSILVDRDYSVFDAFAGGRNSVLPIEDRDPPRNPLFAPRGMPDLCSHSVAQAYYYLVAKPTDPPNIYFWPSHRCVTPEVATEWLRHKGCHEANVRQWLNGDRTWLAVSEPGHYGASWLSLEEADASLRHHGLKWESLSVTYRILRDSMETLVAEYGAQRVRITLWFC